MEKFEDRAEKKSLFTQNPSKLVKKNTKRWIQTKINKNKAFSKHLQKTFTKWILSILLNWFSVLSCSVVGCFSLLSSYRFYFGDGSAWLLFMLMIRILKLREGYRKKLVYVTVSIWWKNKKKPQKCELISLSCSLRALKAI